MQLLNTQYVFKTRKRNDFTTQLKPVLRYLLVYYTALEASGHGPPLLTRPPSCLPQPPPPPR